MADDFKGDDSGAVDETIAVPVSAEPAEVSVSEDPSEIMPDVGLPNGLSPDEKALQDTSGNDKTYEDYARRQAAQEQGHVIDAADHGRTSITEVGKQKKADVEAEKKSQFFEAQQQAEAMRKEWMEKDHDFGGMKMSGHDLAKMLDFISNPQMQDKLRERLGKSGVPKEKIDKGMKELNEYIDLKKKEQEGGKLTEEQQRRLKELEKSEEFKVVAQQAVRVAQEYGVTVKAGMAEAQAKNLATAVQDNVRKVDIDMEAGVARSKEIQVAKNSEDEDLDAIGGVEEKPKTVASVVNPVSFVAASARENFASAPSLTEKFGASSALPVVAQYSDPKLALTAQVSNEDDGVDISLNQFVAKMPLAMGSARA